MRRPCTPLVVLSIPLFAHLLACGYPSYYPKTQSRTGGDLSAIPDLDELPCSTELGAAPVEVLVTATEPVNLFLRDPDCVESLVASFAEGTTEAQFYATPGTILVVRSPTQELLMWFEIPDTGGAAVLQTVP